MKESTDNSEPRSEVLPSILKAPYEQNEQGSTRMALSQEMFEPFPLEVVWQEERLVKKDELHVTLMHPKSLPKLANVPNEEFAAFLDSFLKEKPVNLVSLTDDFRVAEEQGNKTIVVRCVVSNLDELFARFNRQFDVQLPLQATHVTLYTLVKNKGIYIDDERTMESLARVHIPELSEAFLKSRLLA